MQAQGRWYCKAYFHETKHLSLDCKCPEVNSCRQLRPMLRTTINYTGIYSRILINNKRLLVQQVVQPNSKSNYICALLTLYQSVFHTNFDWSCKHDWLRASNVFVLSRRIWNILQVIDIYIYIHTYIFMNDRRRRSKISSHYGYKFHLNGYRSNSKFDTSYYISLKNWSHHLRSIYVQVCVNTRANTNKWVSMEFEMTFDHNFGLWPVHRINQLHNASETTARCKSTFRPIMEIMINSLTTPKVDSPAAGQ